MQPNAPDRHGPRDGTQWLSDPKLGEPTTAPPVFTGPLLHDKTKGEFMEPGDTGGVGDQEGITILVIDKTNMVLLDQLGRRTDALEYDLDRLHNSLHEMFANFEVQIVRGYLIKVWPGTETGEWVAECPTVGVAVQEKSRDEALEAVAVMIDEMLEVKQEFGDPIPPKDL